MIYTVCDNEVENELMRHEDILSGVSDLKYRLAAAEEEVEKGKAIFEENKDMLRRIDDIRAMYNDS